MLCQSATSKLDIVVAFRVLLASLHISSHCHVSGITRLVNLRRVPSEVRVTINMRNIVALSPFAPHASVLAAEFTRSLHLGHRQFLAWRQASTSTAKTDQSKPGPPATPPQDVPEYRGIMARLFGKKKPEQEYTPKPLNRPLGYSTPPMPGQNIGDTRSWKERRDDFLDRNKHTERRKLLSV